VNASTRAVAAHLEALEQAPATPDGDAVVYGPLTRCMLPDQGCDGSNEAEARVAVQIGDGGTVAFELTVRPVGATDEEEVVYARGWTRAGEAGTEGQLAIDLDALGAVGVACPYTGALALGFAKAGEAKALSFRLLAFHADWSGPEMFRAYTAYHNAAGVTRVRAADYVDVIPGPRGHELSVERLVAHPAYGERSFSAISNWVDSRPNGDVAYEGGWSESFWYRRSCSRVNGAAVEEWFFCASAQPLAQCTAAGPAYSRGADGATWRRDVRPRERARRDGAARERLVRRERRLSRGRRGRGRRRPPGGTVRDVRRPAPLLGRAPRRPPRATPVARGAASPPSREPSLPPRAVASSRVPTPAGSPTPDPPGSRPPGSRGSRPSGSVDPDPE
jgi:hypothetical protein